MRISSWRRFFFITPAFLAVSYGALVLPPFPALDEFTSRPASRVVLAKDGTELYISALSDGMWNRHLDLERLPVDIWRLLQTVEDKRFFLHPGIDPLALARAIGQYMSSGTLVSGGSTITMQLARMVLRPSPDKKNRLFWQKAAEMATALRIEARLTKREILELWLNRVPFGYQTRGIASAALKFYDLKLDELSLAQLLSLGLMPRNPTVYNPVLNPETAISRILVLADQLGIPLTGQEVREGVEMARWGSRPDLSPHFARAILSTETGMELTTSLDYKIQRIAEDRLYSHISMWAGSRIKNGAVLLVDNSDGSVLGYVGSQEFGDSDGGQIDGIHVRNQPGSTLKPFLYAYALEMGYSPSYIIDDVPTDFGSESIYVPRNFNQRYNGPVRLRSSLASSLNVPAVAILEQLGVGEFASFLVALGFESIEEQLSNGYHAAGLGLALGNSPVSLWELVQAFSVIPRRGVFIPIGSTNVGDPESRRAMSETTADMVFNILADSSERVTGFGRTDPFYSRVHAAVKTGTSSQNQNIWALAATQSYTVGVWLGNHSGETVVGRTGSSVPARIALEVLEAVHDSVGPVPAKTRVVPGDSIGTLSICSVSGMAAGEWCVSTRQEFSTAEDDAERCTYHSGSDAKTSYPPVFSSWMAAYGKSGVVDSDGPEVLEIRYPADGAVYYYDGSLSAEKQGINIEVLHPPGSIPYVRVHGSAETPRLLSPRVQLNPGLSAWPLPITRGIIRIEVTLGGLQKIHTVEVR